MTTDSAGPAMGVYRSSPSAALVSDHQPLPAYPGAVSAPGWLVQASHVALDGHGWSDRGWITVVAWTAILSAGAASVYRRDTNRV